MTVCDVFQTISPISQARAAAAGKPVWIGSGTTAESLAESAPLADGFIVGTALKTDGRAENPVDPARASAFVDLARKAFAV